MPHMYVGERVGLSVDSETERNSWVASLAKSVRGAAVLADVGSYVSALVYSRAKSGKLKARLCIRSGHHSICPQK